MKTIKHLLVAALIILIAVLGTKLADDNDVYLALMSFLILGFFVFNLILRRSLSAKKYFTSKLNIFTNKVWAIRVYDIPRDLMFEKILEVVSESKFKLLEVDKVNFEILAITKTTFKSWGENLYITIEPKGEETLLKCCSTTLFQIYDWGKNEENTNNLLNEIDLSLTV